MIQLNLLPDVKIAYIKARSQRRLVTSISIIVSAAALGICILLFAYVHFAQVKSSNDLSKDITSSSDELSSTKDLNKILTVQNQLLSIDGLHDQKSAVDRLADYIAKTTPTNVKLNQFDVDFTTKKITANGKTGSLDQVNAYVDTLKYMQYVTEEDKTPKKAFSDVVLASFSRGDDGANFSVTFSYDESLFNLKKTITLSISHREGESQPVQSDNNDAFDTEGGQ